MSQPLLPFHYDRETRPAGTTALAGLPTYLELASVNGLRAAIRRNVGVRAHGQGWSDDEITMSLVMMQLAGGESVSDLGLLAKDEGYVRIVEREATRGMGRRQAKKYLQARRAAGDPVVPSASAVFRYLARFHDAGQDSLREPHKAFVPAPNEHLLGLRRANAEQIAFQQRRCPATHATLDMDATVLQTNKAGALFCYKHFKAYQPLNVYWAEQGVMLHSEFRDGNVNCGFEQTRVLAETLSYLPEGVKKASLRTDTQGYEWELLRYCAEGRNERFGVIEFASGVDVTEELRRAVARLPASAWKPLDRHVDGNVIKTEQTWAEVPFVPNASATRKDGPTYRFLVIREPLAQPDLPGIDGPKQMPFPTMDFGGTLGHHKLFACVTNRTGCGADIIRWHRKRCGKSEEAHSVMKEDLAGGRMPSGNFGSNAAWWAIMILALNLNAMMKRLVLGREWETRRLKAIRFAIIGVAGRVIEHSRNLILRLCGDHPSFGLLVAMRRAIAHLAVGPPTPVTA